MSVLDPPRHPIVANALTLSRLWCQGHIIDDAPAFAHAVTVARTLVTHVPHAAPELVAAALLHDSPEFAPASPPLPEQIAGVVSANVYPLVAALHAEHLRMDQGVDPVVEDRELVLVAAADRIVAFTALVRRAERSDDPDAFWQARQPLARLMGYFAAWNSLTADLLPVTMLRELFAAYDRLHEAMCAPEGRTR